MKIPASSSLLWTPTPCCHLVTEGIISELGVTNWKRMRFFLPGGGTVIEMRDRDGFPGKHKEEESGYPTAGSQLPRRQGKTQYFVSI